MSCFRFHTRRVSVIPSFGRDPVYPKPFFSVERTRRPSILSFIPSNPPDFLPPLPLPRYLVSEPEPDRRRLLLFRFSTVRVVCSPLVRTAGTPREPRRRREVTLRFTASITLHGGDGIAPRCPRCTMLLNASRSTLLRFPFRKNRHSIITIVYLHLRLLLEQVTDRTQIVSKTARESNFRARLENDGKNVFSSSCQRTETLKTNDGNFECDGRVSFFFFFFFY